MSIPRLSHDPKTGDVRIPEGWRWLRRGEKLREGDLFICMTWWAKTYRPGKRVLHGPYIRRKK